MSRTGRKETYLSKDRTSVVISDFCPRPLGHPGPSNLQLDNIHFDLFLTISIKSLDRVNDNILIQLDDESPNQPTPTQLKIHIQAFKDFPGMKSES